MATLTAPKLEFTQPSRLTLVLRYMRRNKGLVLGLAILLGLVLFTAIGMLTIDQKHAYSLTVPSKRPPSVEFPLGTDFFGRDLYAAMVVGLWQTALMSYLCFRFQTGCCKSTA